MAPILFPFFWLAAPLKMVFPKKGSLFSSVPEQLSNRLGRSALLPPFLVVRVPLLKKNYRKKGSTSLLEDLVAVLRNHVKLLFVGIDSGITFQGLLGGAGFCPFVCLRLVAFVIFIIFHFSLPGFLDFELFRNIILAATTKSFFWGHPRK